MQSTQFQTKGYSAQQQSVSSELWELKADIERLGRRLEGRDSAYFDIGSQTDVGCVTSSLDPKSALHYVQARDAEDLLTRVKACARDAAHDKDDARQALKLELEKTARLRESLREEARFKGQWEELKEATNLLKQRLDSSERIRRRQKELIQELQAMEADIVYASSTMAQPPHPCNASRPSNLVGTRGNLEGGKGSLQEKMLRPPEQQTRGNRECGVAYTGSPGGHRLRRFTMNPSSSSTRGHRYRQQQSLTERRGGILYQAERVGNMTRRETDVTPQSACKHITSSDQVDALPSSRCHLQKGKRTPQGGKQNLKDRSATDCPPPPSRQSLGKAGVMKASLSLGVGGGKVGWSVGNNCSHGGPVAALTASDVATRRKRTHSTSFRFSAPTLSSAGRNALHGRKRTPLTTTPEQVSQQGLAPRSTTTRTRSQAQSMSPAHRRTSGNPALSGRSWQQVVHACNEAVSLISRGASEVWAQPVGGHGKDKKSRGKQVTQWWLPPPPPLPLPEYKDQPLPQYTQTVGSDRLSRHPPSAPLVTSDSVQKVCTNATGAGRNALASTRSNSGRQGHGRLVETNKKIGMLKG
ncbi:unnamed protein product [Choristocarpus tenellus]